ncbi:MAG: hypothetical protein HC895_04635 [Leptolyngbyaceae cyanobacterium SM1_3_5]|nr:hypothetical protein [Leptolyngbyaceae cyanobacterium SM1_3_5]
MNKAIATVTKALIWLVSCFQGIPKFRTFVAEIAVKDAIVRVHKNTLKRIGASATDAPC